MGRGATALVVGVIAVLAVVTAILMGAAFANAGKVSDEERAQYTPPAVQVEPEPSPVEPEPEPLPEVQVPKRFVFNAGEGHLLRGESGTCGVENAALEVSFDDGVTWEQANSQAAELTQITGFGLVDEGYLEIIGKNAACEETLFVSYSWGSFWEQTFEDINGLWAFDHMNPATIRTPAGTVSAPCEAVSVSSSGASGAAVLCRDSSVIITNDSGANWGPEIQLPYAAAIIMYGSEVYALTGDVSRLDSEVVCDGFQTVSLVDDDGSRSWKPMGGCSPADNLTGSEATLGAGANLLYIWLTDFFRSSI